MHLIIGQSQLDREMQNHITIMMEKVPRKTYKNKESLPSGRGLPSVDDYPIARYNIGKHEENNTKKVGSVRQGAATRFIIAAKLG